MFKGKLGVSRLFDLDDERHPSLGAAEREGLPRVLVRDWVHVPEITIRSALDHATAKLGASSKALISLESVSAMTVRPCAKLLNKSIT